MSEQQKPHSRRWIKLALVALPVLYLISSGPLHAVAFPSPELVGFNADGSAVFRDEDGWWATVYSPLIWVSNEQWGKPIARYWRLFPVVQAKE